MKNDFLLNLLSLICKFRKLGEKSFMTKRKKSSLQSIHGVNHANRIIIKYDKSSFDDAIKCFFPYYHNPSSTGS